MKSFVCNAAENEEAKADRIVIITSDKTYSVYASTRKVREIRKAFLEYCQR